MVDFTSLDQKKKEVTNVFEELRSTFDDYRINKPTEIIEEIRSNAFVFNQRVINGEFKLFSKRYNNTFKKRLFKDGFNNDQFRFIWDFSCRDLRIHSKYSEAYKNLQTIINNQIDEVKKSKDDRLSPALGRLRNEQDIVRNYLPDFFKHFRNGISRRDFLKYGKRAVMVAGVVLLEPYIGTVAKASTLLGKEYITDFVLRIEHKYQKYLEIKNFNLESMINECRIIIDEMKQYQRNSIKGILNAQNEILKKHLQKIIVKRDIDDIKYLCMALRKKEADCDILSYFFYDANDQASIIYLPDHAMIEFNGIYMETLLDNAFPSVADILFKYRTGPKKILPEHLNETIFLKNLKINDIKGFILGKYATDIALNGGKRGDKEYLYKAKELATKAIGYNELNFTSYYALAVADYYLGNYPESYKNFEMAQKRHPGSEGIQRMIKTVKSMMN